MESRSSAWRTVRSDRIVRQGLATLRTNNESARITGCPASKTNHWVLQQILNHARVAYSRRGQGSAK